MANDPKSKLHALLKSGGGASRGAIIHSESELVKMFTVKKCTTKTDMIMCLHDDGSKHNDIAVTLREYGILTQKSAYQMVRNTIDRVSASRLIQKSA